MRKRARKKFEKDTRPVLDLHGQTVSEALHRLEYFISDAVMSGAQQVEVMHGIGSGALQRAVHAYLKSCPVIRMYKFQEQNTGTTVVYF